MPAQLRVVLVASENPAANQYRSFSTHDEPLGQDSTFPKVEATGEQTSPFDSAIGRAFLSTTILAEVTEKTGGHTNEDLQCDARRYPDFPSSA